MLRFAAMARFYFCREMYSSMTLFLLASLVVCLSYLEGQGLGGAPIHFMNASCASLLGASGSFSLFINPIILLLIGFLFFGLDTRTLPIEPDDLFSEDDPNIVVG